jgi:hypothetical protein
MGHGVTRRTLLGAVGAASLSGCLGTGLFGGSSGDDGTTDPPDAEGPPTTDARLPLPLSPSALRDEAVSGGVPKDGIPAIDDPSFVDAASAASWLSPQSPVFGVAGEADVKAYPQSILVSHEVCNDVVDGTPVSVTYCPLTGTAMGFERGPTTFGVSGRLVNNNLIMYDRATETWWPQVLATSIPGPWNEDPPVRTLQQFPVVWTTWDRWRAAYPETRVLSRDTGYAMNYERDPYGSYTPRRADYYAPRSQPLFPSLSDDDRLAPKRVVLGARTSAGAVAVVKNRLRVAKLAESTVGETPVVAAYDPELDTGHLYENPDGESFTYSDGAVLDGSGARHPPADLPLDRLHSLDAMWFAWSGFYPDTALHV